MIVIGILLLLITVIFIIFAVLISQHVDLTKPVVVPSIVMPTLPPITTTSQPLITTYSEFIKMMNGPNRYLVSENEYNMIMQDALNQKIINQVQPYSTFVSEYDSLATVVPS